MLTMFPTQPRLRSGPRSCPSSLLAFEPPDDLLMADHPLTVAEKLPFHVLTRSFLDTIESDPFEKQHGGKLVEWDSNESLRSMVRVCPAWEEAGMRTTRL
jgi:hypothetical protein